MLSTRKRKHYNVSDAFHQKAKTLLDCPLISPSVNRIIPTDCAREWWKARLEHWGKPSQLHHGVDFSRVDISSGQGFGCVDARGQREGRLRVGALGHFISKLRI